MSESEKAKLRAIQNLDKALSDIHFDKQEAYDLLRELDYNPDRLVNKHLQNIKKLQVKVEIQHAKDKRASVDLIKLALEQIDKFRSKFKSAPKKLLDEFYQGEFAFKFRKLEELSDQDALEMLEEAQLLKLIKELEKRNDG